MISGIGTSSPRCVVYLRDNNFIPFFVKNIANHNSPSVERLGRHFSLHQLSFFLDVVEEQRSIIFAATYLSLDLLLIAYCLSPLAMSSEEPPTLWDQLVLGNEADADDPAIDAAHIKSAPAGDAFPTCWRNKSTHNPHKIRSSVMNPWVKGVAVVSSVNSVSIYDVKKEHVMVASVTFDGDDGLELNWGLHYKPAKVPRPFLSELSNVSSVMIDQVSHVSHDLLQGADPTLVISIEDDAKEELKTMTAPLHFLQEFGLESWPMADQSWSMCCENCQLGGVRQWPTRLLNIWTRSEARGRSNCPSFFDLKRCDGSGSWWDTEFVASASDLHRHFRCCRSLKECDMCTFAGGHEGTATAILKGNWPVTDIHSVLKLNRYGVIAYTSLHFAFIELLVDRQIIILCDGLFYAYNKGQQQTPKMSKEQVLGPEQKNMLIMSYSTCTKWLNRGQSIGKRNTIWKKNIKACLNHVDAETKNSPRARAAAVAAVGAKRVAFTKEERDSKRRKDASADT